MTTTCLLSTTYFGPIQWYQKLYRYDRVLIEAHESYQKQTYRNRCLIATTQGVQALTIPIEHLPLTIDHSALTIEHLPLTIDHSALTIEHLPLTIDHSALTIEHLPLTIDHSALAIDKPDAQPMFNVQWSMVNGQSSMFNSQSSMFNVLLSDHGNWRHLHWQALQSAYGDSPFFEYYEDDLRPFFTERRWERLIDFNTDICQTICRLLDIHPNIGFTEKYSKNGDFIDFREVIRPKHPLPDPDFRPRRYWQVFEQKHGFLPNLSILDLLFNMGPESIFFL